MGRLDVNNPQLHTALSRMGEIIVGKEHALKLALTCLLARGHLLIEDVPGVGKTTLSHVLARTLGLDFSRVQFTSDLLPADILGVSIFDRASNRFEFRPGPIFAQVVLADEVNRATPKTQSALLEAMEEQQVSLEGATHRLPEPFFVIATQNPLYQIGTFALPESQLDRFLMRLSLGYPSAAAERALLQGVERRQLIEQLQPALDPAALVTLQHQVEQIHVAEPLLDYLQALLHHSRHSAHFAAGLSPRAGLALLRAARAWALLHDRDHVAPEDIQAVLPGVAGHRLRAGGDQVDAGPEQLARTLLDEVAIP